jgi:hypothetical protein
MSQQHIKLLLVNNVAKLQASELAADGDDSLNMLWLNLIVCKIELKLLQLRAPSQ